jgi:hypothetical protein
MLDPSRPVCGLTETTVIAVSFPKQTILPKANVSLGKVAELAGNSATYFVHPWAVLTSHEPVVQRIE